MAPIARRGHGPMKAFAARTAQWPTCLGAIVAAALAAPGCGGSSANSYSVQVWGRVTYNGKPVEAGALIFMPGPTTRSNWGFGFIAEDGKYTLISNETDVSLEPGRFIIFITPPSPHDKRKHSRLGEEEESDERAIAIAALYPVPKRFFSPETSGLWVDLKKEPTRVDIDLKD
jgi:hypothetical protein